MLIAPYEERKVDRFEKDKLIVDTCAASDSEKPYETGISHPLYKEGKWVIVEEYDTKEEAKKGHKKWVKIMTAENLPEYIEDVSSAEVAKLRNTIYGKRPRYSA